MVEKQPKEIPVGVVMVAEESLDAMKEFSDRTLLTVERIMILVKNFRSSEHFTPCSSIPDDAPEKVKNQIADGQGRAYKIGITMDDETNLCLSWYEPYDRQMLFFWDIVWPAEVIIVDEA